MNRLTIIIAILSITIISCGTETDTSEDPDLISQNEQVFGQGVDGSTINNSEAAIHRSRNNGVFTELTMPTPDPGSYNYPEDAEQGQPKVFTLWIFAFNDPQAEQFDAAYLGSAHVADNPEENIRLNGHITSETEPFTGEGNLTDYIGARIRLAVAPHGNLDPDKLPDQLTTPSGEANHWWYAEFENPEDE